MQKTISTYIQDLPEGCFLNDAIRTEKGIILIPSMTILTSDIIRGVKDYNKKINATITFVDKSEIQKEKAFEFSDSFKKYAAKSLAALYKNIDNPEEVISVTRDIGNKIITGIENSDHLGVNLEKLKISDEYILKHSIDVGTMAGLTAKRLGLSSKQIENATMAGLLHDIGKAKIPNSIMNKPGKLTENEHNIIKLHPTYGYQLLANSKEIDDEVKLGILNHHENYDGSGYPRGVKHERIGMIGEILSIVDVFDALLTERPYKEAKTPAQTLEIMFTMTSKFNIDFFRAFLSIVSAYPNGSVIKLSNGENAVVTEQNASYPLRPIVKVLQTNETIDLSRDKNYLSVVISK